MIFLPAIPQDPGYHHFADRRTFLSIPNFWNVISNIPFVVIGSLGLWMCSKNKTTGWNYVFFFFGIMLTGFGSSYYHWKPDNHTLIWDRLPMTISFMSFFSIIICEYITRRSENLILLQLILIGMLSVLYWQHTEELGHGDLRLYVLVQFLPMILIPPIMLIFRPRPPGTTYLWLLLLSYAIAKLAESADEELFIYFLSGHTFKHFFAALAPLMLLDRSRKYQSAS
jgi:hypothetical protein